MNTLLWAVLLTAADPCPGPLHCEAAVVSKGEVKAGPPLLHTFDLSHCGQGGTIRITQVEAGCGCLRQSLSTDVLPPGATARLTIEVNTLTQPEGPNRWPIVISYRYQPPQGPPQDGRLRLVITAHLCREVRVSPPQVAFSTAGAATQVVMVVDPRPRPLTVLKAVASDPSLTVEIGRREAGRGQPVTLRLAADAPAGRRDARVVLLTDDPDYPEFHIPVQVQKQAPDGVRATPDAIVWRVSADQVETSALVRLRAADGRPVAIRSATCDDPAVTVRWSAGVGPSATLRVTLAAATAPLSGTSVVRVDLAEPPGGQVLVPVAWSRAKTEP